MLTKSIMQSEISNELKHLNSLEKDVAFEAYSSGLRWIDRRPKLWMKNPSLSRLEQRREFRKNKEAIREQLYNHVYDTLQTYPSSTSESKSGSVHVIGMGWILSTTLSMIVSWVVRKLLERYFRNIGMNDE